MPARTGAARCGWPIATLATASRIRSSDSSKRRPANTSAMHTGYCAASTALPVTSGTTRASHARMPAQKPAPATGSVQRTQRFPASVAHSHSTRDAVPGNSVATPADNGRTANATLVVSHDPHRSLYLVGAAPGAGAHMRQCTECHTPLDRRNPPMKPVKLREGQPGYGIPCLRVTLYGALCGACVRASMQPRRVRR